jgi:hypothetical protein
MRGAARDVREGDSAIVVAVVGLTVNVDNAVRLSASATAGGLPSESRARAPPPAVAGCTTLCASSHGA